MSITRREFINLSAVAVSAQAVPVVGCPDLQLRFGVAQFDKYDPLADIDRLEGWGFDYCEPQVVKVLALSDQQFEAARRRAAASWIHVEVMNSFVPADLKVVGPAVDRPRVDEHIRRALGRAEALGAKVIVFGSGDARMIPSGFPRDQAWRQLQQFLRSVGDEIDRRKYGMVIGIEALRAAESNVVNSQMDAYRLAEDTQHPKIQIICDYFHLMSEGENPNVLLKIRDRLVHLHFSNPVKGRWFPRDVSESEGYRPFFENLRAIKYRGRLSLEANTANFESDAPAGLAVVRRLYGAACSA